MGGRCLADNPPLGLVVFQFYGKVGTEKTKSQGGIFMHMADALVTPAVAGTMYACPAAVLVFIYEARTELLYGSDVTQAEAGKLSFKKIYQKFWRSGKHSGPYTCEAGLTGTQCACQICHHAG